MPFRSEKQRKFMWAKHPDIARHWTEDYGNKIVKKKPYSQRRRGKK